MKSAIFFLFGVVVGTVGVLTKSHAPIIVIEGQSVKVGRVYDGDTFKIDIENLPPVFGDDMSIRIRGINAPEIRGGTDASKAKARASRDFLSGLMAGNVVTIHNLERGKYFRVVADVRVNGYDVAREMIDREFANAYMVK